MKNVAADEAEVALEVERRQDLAGDDRCPEAGRVSLDRLDHQVGDRLARLVPRAPVRQLRRDMLAEERGDVAPGRRERIVERRGDQHFDDRRPRPAVEPRVHEGALHVGEARARSRFPRRDARPPRAPGRQEKLGSSAKRDVHPEGARAAAIAMRCGRGSRPAARPDRAAVSKVSFGCRLETTARAAIFSPRPVTTPTARPFSTRISLTAALGADLDAARGAGARHRLGDRAHAADRVAPDALLAVHLAEQWCSST